MNYLFDIVQDTNAPLEHRIDAASKLWYLSHLAQDIVRDFKQELIDHTGDGQETITFNGIRSKALVVPQRPSVSLEGLSRDQLIEALGIDLYEKYIAESRNLRWALYKEAPQAEVDQLLNRLPNKPATHQVKFLKKD
jgi:hypothetical protein